MKLFVLLYASNTVLMAESAEDLQKQLIAFSNYSDIWKLTVNVDKTKVLVFGMGSLPRDLTFTFKDNLIEIVKEFNYLGVIFKKTCSFDVTKNSLTDKATKAKYEVLKIGRKYKLNIKLQIDLFDKMVKPIFYVVARSGALEKLIFWERFI